MPGYATSVTDTLVIHRDHVISQTRVIHSIVAYLLLASSTVGLCSTWEQEPDAQYFWSEDIEAVKRILAKEDYSPRLKVDVLENLILAGKVKVVKYLAARGWLKVCRKAKSCNTVDYATDNVEMLQFLLSQGFPITKETLKNAATNGNLDSVRFLCEKGVDPNAKIQYEAYSDTAKISGTGTVLDFIKAGQPYSGGRPFTTGDPLRDAKYPASIVRVAEFLESGQCKKGALPSARTDSYAEGAAALREGNVDAVKLLFEQRDTGKTHPRIFTYLLYEAVTSGSIELLQHLKSIGWIKKCHSIGYCRPFEVAAQFGVNEQVFEFLFTESFQLDEYSDVYGATPIHYAALFGHINAVKFLCERGANPRNSITYEGKPTSLLTEIRERYGRQWCSLYATSNKAASEACDSGELGGITGPDDCMPGSTCLSVKFPPSAQGKDTQKLVGLSGVFRYLKDGGCTSGKVESCQQNTIKEGAILAQKINVRSAPSLSSEVVDSLKFGTYVKIIEDGNECVTVGGRTGRWVKVTTEWWNPHVGPVIEGWVFDAYIDYLPGGFP